MERVSNAVLINALLIESARRKPVRTLVFLVISAKIVLLVSCSPSPAERGCQLFAELVDDVAESLTVPGRMLDSISGEEIVSQLNNPEFELRPGESEEARSRRFAIAMGASAVVAYLGVWAEISFHDDRLFARPAYNLWKSAAVVESGASRGIDDFDVRIFADQLANRCAERGYPVPRANPVVISEYLEKAVASR